MSETVIFFFFWGPSLCITDPDWGRDCLGDTNPLKGQLLVSHLLYKVKHPISTLRQSSVRNSYILFLLGTKSLHHRSRLRKRLFGWHQPLKGPALSLPSLVQSKTPDQHIKTVQCPKQLYSFSFGDQVFASQIQTKEEVVLVTMPHSGSALSLPSLALRNSSVPNRFPFLSCVGPGHCVYFEVSYLD